MYFGPTVRGINDELHLARAVFDFRRDIKYSSEYILYTFISMAAEIGGYVGIFLGISIVNIGDYVNKLLEFCISMRAGWRATSARVGVRTEHSGGSAEQAY